MNAYVNAYSNHTLIDDLLGGANTEYRRAIAAWLAGLPDGTPVDTIPLCVDSNGKLPPAPGTSFGIPGDPSLNPDGTGRGDIETIFGIGGSLWEGLGATLAPIFIGGILLIAIIVMIYLGGRKVLGV